MRLKKLLQLTTMLALFLSFVHSSLAQNRTVTGTVTDQNGIGLPGVTVTVKGTSNATSTDANGAFSINAPENGTLVFTSVGYGMSEVSINGRTNVNASLQTQNSSLSEVVV